MSNNNISNYSSYISGMNKSYLDKLFFLDKIENVDAILDFGCAQGDMLRHIHDISPEIDLYGYDNNSEMIAKANDCHSDIAIFDEDFNVICKKIDTDTALLNLSSVIHEVYSYSKPNEIKEFWKRVFDSGFQYISIRDLCLSKTADRETDMNDYVKAVIKSTPTSLKEFESIWGKVRNNKQLIHYLMKYRYIDNWQREVRENYFPITTEELLSKIPIDKYEIIYFEDYVLPYTYQKVKEDFGIEIKDNTHVKILLRKKEN